MGHKKNIQYENPKWPDKKHYQNVIKDLSTYPNLVFPNEIVDLKNELIEVSYGK